MASSAFAGATVELVVTDLGNTPCNGIDGCVFGQPLYHGGGDTVLVHVMVTASQDLLVRGAQIDWGGSSRELDLGRDIDTVNQPLDGVPNFWFDYSSITIGGFFAQGTYPANGIGPFGSTTGGYTDFSNLQQTNQPVAFVAATVWAVTTESSSMLALEAGVPFRLGGMTVTMPIEFGCYTLDLLNLANTDNSDFGMVLDFGFGGDGDPITKWASAAEGEGVDDVITYANGPLKTICIPEPVTLILLGLGGLAAAVHRQASPVPPTRAD